MKKHRCVTTVQKNFSSCCYSGGKVRCMKYMKTNRQQWGIQVSWLNLAELHLLLILLYSAVRILDWASPAGKRCYGNTNTSYCVLLAHSLTVGSLSYNERYTGCTSKVNGSLKKKCKVELERYILSNCKTPISYSRTLRARTKKLS